MIKIFSWIGKISPNVLGLFEHLLHDLTDVWQWSDVSSNTFGNFHWYPELLLILITNY